MVDLNRQYGEKIRFLAINIAVGDTLKSIRSFMKKNGNGLTVLYDDKREVPVAYKVIATPHIVLIDEKGYIQTVVRNISIDDIHSLLGEENDS